MEMSRQKLKFANLFDHYDEDIKYWTHHHNPRTVANNPAGEITVNLGLTGPHYTIGAACAAGNAGIIQGVQQLRLGECDFALAGGVVKVSVHTVSLLGLKAKELLPLTKTQLGQAVHLIRA